ncbi:MAG: ATP-binding protein [Melioribacteraceae bacterium]|nr:ATP-binding protein [Melioribacteraceae bacterium]
MKIITNPFAFGKIVKGKQFFNRKKEIAELISDINNHQNIILYAPRRYGKTSLVLKTFEELKKKQNKFIGLYIDFYQVNSIEKFITIMSNEYAANSKLSLEKLLNQLKNLLTGISPTISLDKDGNPKIDISISPNQKDKVFEDVMKLPQKLVDDGNIVAVFLDEFQEITNLNGFEFQKRLRSIIQHQNKVSYIFCGSKHHLFQNIFSNPNNPLFKAGKTKYLGAIAENDYSTFIQKHFVKIKKEFTKHDAKTIYNLAGTIPYNIQLLCNEIYNLMMINKNYPMNELIIHGYENILDNKNEEYIIMYDKLSRSARLGLEIIINSNGDHVFNKEILAEFRTAPSTLKKALDTLVQYGILFRENKKYLFQDIFFKRWLEQRI